ADVGIRVENPYEGEVAFMQFHLGLMFNQIESMLASADELLIVCFSDHGEDLAGWYVDDHAGKGHPEEEGHGCLLYDVTQVVPLWLRMPGRVPSGLEVDRQVRLVDVTPTILDLLGLEADGMD